MENTLLYQKVINANIELHTELSKVYNETEPHFRKENVAKVKNRLKEVFDRSHSQKHLDLGCGSGFIIHIAKEMVKEIWGIDVTQAMMDKIDTLGACDIKLINHDTGSVKLPENYFDSASAYSFLHHLYDVKPTLTTTFRSLKKGGILYADLDPNFYFWQQINLLDQSKKYQPIVAREVDAVLHKDDDIAQKYGVDASIFNHAEYGKNIRGGFKEEEIIDLLNEVGFSEITFFYHWFLGEGQLINDQNMIETERFAKAKYMNECLQSTLPVSRNLYKYVGFYAVK